MANVPFAFLPRAVSKHAKPWQGISARSTSPSPDPTTKLDEQQDDDDDDDDDDDELHSEPSSLGNGKGRERALELAQSKRSTFTQDIASLIALALSDYNVWLDPDMRHKLDASLSDETTPDGAGFVPINYLLRRAPCRSSLSSAGSGPQREPAEAEVVKALRTHAGDVLEVRMRIPSESESVWYGTGKTSRKKDVGGYEVRRKDWPSLCRRPSRGWTRARWDAMTIYMEGIPPLYRTVGGVARFVEVLLMQETDRDAVPRLSCVQNVFLPPHYLDKPGDAPKCKGYALITFSAVSHAEALLRAWPWKRRDVLVLGEDANASQAVKEAHKYGMRVISKARWEALNEEYLVYKQSLVDEMAQCATAEECHLQNVTEVVDGPEGHGGETEMPRRTTPASPFPLDCLVLVRNVHPETNKTTLRALFAGAFQGDVGGPGRLSPPQTQARTQAGSVGLDYVDFTKGVDTCYLRLASPHHATRLIAFLDARGIVQADGLDAVGRAPAQGDRPIAAEMVRGKREEVYWEKVPEKVRRQAVDNLVFEASAGPSSESSAAHTQTIRGSGQKKRSHEP